MKRPRVQKPIQQSSSKREVAERPKGVKPQAACECKSTTNSWWCDFGRGMQNTGVPC